MTASTIKAVISIGIGILIGLSRLRNSGLAKIIITITGGQRNDINYLN